ncbi:transcriptional regulator BetI [Litorisediminicola beolgyonensis]|uniref:HTH-type transcriptional regulator BetI n=1 Tax=Litorisediminicola beolgyonensis TaxID=1173614 RepID=A0ABW3ZEW8_9RHOB
MSASQKETQRRRDLIAATLQEIGAHGTLSVTVGQIAKRAGVSPGLAFHYFGDKEALFLAAMRAVLRRYRRAVVAALREAETPEARIEAVISASFDATNFQDGAVAAWLNFYVLAQTAPEARRLLEAYHARLDSTLRHALRPLLGQAAPVVAGRLAALIDGLYLRQALTSGSPREAEAQIRAALADALAGQAPGR